MASEATGSPRSGWVRVFAFLLAVTALLFLFEGLASFALFAEALVTGEPEVVAERRHTRYDAGLGWVNEPGFHDADFYGPGRALSINAQGFRGTRDVTPKPAPDRPRVVCSGDSFTLGYGVGDADTWCARLETTVQGVEAVNMGQGGYGIGQSYLWYRRDGAGLRPRVHLFAFITADFGRMLSESFLGYGKPVVRVRAGELAIENVPVPRGSYRVPWLVSRREAFASLRSVAFLRRVLGREAFPAPSDPTELPRVATSIFAELARINGAQGTELVLVYLPMRGDAGGGRDGRIARFVRKAAKNHGLELVDLVDEAERLPPERRRALFLAPGAVPYPGASGHLSREGNRWVAGRLATTVRGALAPDGKP
ncbi:MAG: hypothetical protein QNK04_02045 [Myxococcota bacterium]|nr:hypothetical protein [Myxococcota bacterium]